MKNINFKRQLFAKITHDNVFQNKIDRAQQKIEYWDKFRKDRHDAEESAIHQNNLQKRVQIFVAHAYFLRVVKKLESNIAFRNHQIYIQTMKNIVVRRFQRSYKIYIQKYAQNGGPEFDRRILKWQSCNRDIRKTRRVLTIGT